MGKEEQLKPYTARGTDAPWYRGWNISEEERERFRKISRESREAKARALAGLCDDPKHPIPTPHLNPLELMPELEPNGLRALSLFSGCGGLDLGFDRAGYKHVASFDILSETGEVLSTARPNWVVFSGAEGDVTQINWSRYRGQVDVVHGGPPCQPFSQAGSRSGAEDVRDMIPHFADAVLKIRPRAFVCENVLGLTSKKFQGYVQENIFDRLKSYHILQFRLEASHFGVPQRRRRVFFVGFRRRSDAERFLEPQATHDPNGSADIDLPPTMGVRKALGLSDIGFDSIAPTLRSGWTGPRNTTSIVNSAAAVKSWGELGVWPHGVARDRQAASAFVAKNGHYRLSIQDCMLLQGFPEDWPIEPPVYKALGLIGNSVSPPMGYAVAKAVATALC